MIIVSTATYRPIATTSSKWECSDCETPLEIRGVAKREKIYGFVPAGTKFIVKSTYCQTCDETMVPSWVQRDRMRGELYRARKTLDH